MQKLVLATSNAGKIQEMTNVLKEYGFTVYSQDFFNIQSPEETGLTFVENAILKARYASESSGLPAISDDSGLVVDALNGQPGLYSARYAGEDGNASKNRAKLLENLKEIPLEQRQAKFVCVMALIRHALDPTPIVAFGECHGLISTSEKGKNGHGYDSLFLDTNTGLTFAEMEFDYKQKLSHRAKALLDLQKKLYQL